MRGWLLSPAQRARRSILAALALAPLAGALGACAFRNSPFGGYSPMLWRVRHPHGGGTAWLFGSIHAGLDRFYPLPEAVENAWHSADSLAIEIDVQARWNELRQSFAQRTRLPEGQVIDSLIGASTARAIRTHFGFDPLTWQRMRRLQPWALSMTLSNPLDRETGVSSHFGIDRFFVDRARRRSMPVVELEQPGEQVEAFAGGSYDEQVAQLLRRFEQLRRWDNLLGDTIDAWRIGDAQQLAELKRRAWGDISERPLARERMFADRDRRMAARLAGLLERPTTVFTVVGAFHLSGPDALTGMLAGLGLRVERFRYDSDTGKG